jgi:hypothetical protein
MTLHKQQYSQEGKVKRVNENVIRLYTIFFSPPPRLSLIIAKGHASPLKISLHTFPTVHTVEKEGIMVI